MVELLNTYTAENASEAKEDAKNCIVSFLAKSNVLIMDHLLRLRPVAALEGEPIHRVRYCTIISYPCTFCHEVSNRRFLSSKVAHHLHIGKTT